MRFSREQATNHSDDFGFLFCKQQSVISSPDCFRTVRQLLKASFSGTHKSTMYHCVRDFACEGGGIGGTEKCCVAPSVAV
jgi:hypothetical protein